MEPEAVRSTFGADGVRGAAGELHTLASSLTEDNEGTAGTDASHAPGASAQTDAAATSEDAEPEWAGELEDAFGMEGFDIETVGAGLQHD